MIVIGAVYIVPWNLAYRRHSYKGAGAYIWLRAPRLLYQALFYKYQISFIDSETLT